MKEEEGLLPKSLFSASSLRKEQTRESLEQTIVPARSQLNNNNNTFSNQNKEKHVLREISMVDFNNYTSQSPTSNSIISRNMDDICSIDSSSSEEEEEMEKEEDEDRTELPLHQDSSSIAQLNKNSQQLLLKLERQQVKQDKYLSKLKNIHESISKINSLLGQNSALMNDLISNESASNNSSHEPTPTPTNTAKRIIIIDDDVPVPKQRKLNLPLKVGKQKEIQHDHLASTSQTSHRSLPANTNEFKIVPKRNVFKEIDLAKSDTMDTFTIRKRQYEVVFAKKPRSLLRNTADPDVNSDLSDLMITTSLDGDLQFWNSKSRVNIKTIGKGHLYNSWIDDACWITPFTLALYPPQKSEEPVKLVHLKNITSSNVEGRVQALNKHPHDNGISAIVSANAEHSSRNMEKCNFVTGGYDKSVYLWSLKRSSADEEFDQVNVTPLYFKHTSAIQTLCYDKYKHALLSGGADERFFHFDLQTNTILRELRLSQRISHVQQNPANPNYFFITVASRSEQFFMFDQRCPGFDGIQLKFGQSELENLSRFVKADIHENGYTFACGSQSSAKLNFWDVRYTGVTRNPSFTMDTSNNGRVLRSVFISESDTIVNIASDRSMTWLDYRIEKNAVIKTFN